MKSMTCEQLGGACDKLFIAETFDEISEMSKKHGMDMFQKKDEAHLKAMNEMQTLMKSPNDINTWFKNKREEFNLLPEE
mgnify:CR=1 FL=1|jgi:hypothetical protein